MKSVLGRSLSAAALVAIMAATAVPAEARPHWGRHHRHHGGGDDAAWAIGGGIIGLGIGAALASSGRNRGDRYHDRYYGGDYYRDGYYGGDRYYGGGYYDRGYDDRRYYDRGYYDPRYYDREYYGRGYYGGGYEGSYYADNDCRSHRVYDPYLRRTVRVSYCD